MTVKLELFWAGSKSSKKGIRYLTNLIVVSVEKNGGIPVEDWSASEEDVRITENPVSLLEHRGKVVVFLDSEINGVIPAWRLSELKCKENVPVGPFVKSPEVPWWILCFLDQSTGVMIKNWVKNSPIEKSVLKVKGEGGQWVMTVFDPCWPKLDSGRPRRRVSDGTYTSGVGFTFSASVQVVDVDEEKRKTVCVHTPVVPSGTREERAVSHVMEKHKDVEKAQWFAEHE